MGSEMCIRDRNILVPNTRRKVNVLETYTTDLNEKAKKGMSVKRNGNVVSSFVETYEKKRFADVGKTALVEELSRRIVEDKDINWEIQDYTVIQLDITGMVAGHLLEESLKNV